ncbi:proline-rich domain-containing protein [Streptomyces sp. NPDC001927]
MPARAEPNPSATTTPISPPTTAPGGRTPTAEELAEIEKIVGELNKRVSSTMQEAYLRSEEERLRKLLPDEGGVLAVFNVTDRNGMPISAYTVKSDTGGLMDWDLGLQNLLAELAFMSTKWVIAFCCWLLVWALSFGPAKLLLAPVLSVANSLHAQVILQMGLPSLFLAVCALVCVARIFFGDRAKGWADAALSLLIAGLTATLLSSPPQLLLGEQDSAIAAARGLALEVADIILDANPGEREKSSEDEDSASSRALSRPLTNALTDAFIVKPAMLLQYGRVFEGDCAKKYSDTKVSQLAYDRAMSQQTERLKKYNNYRSWIDPSGAMVTDWTLPIAKQWAVDHFGNPPMEAFEAECVQGDAQAAKRASMDKVGGAIFLLIAALIVTVLIAGLTGSFLVAQCRIAWDAVRAEPALVAGTVPGAGRAYLWDWAASVLHSLGQLLASIVGLAVLILIIQAVLDPVQQDWGNELTLRFLAVDIVCIAAIRKRRALTVRSQQVAANFRAKMSAGRFGGANGSIFTPSSTPVARNQSITRRVTRGAVRTTMVGVSLATGNPVASLGYATSSNVSAVALLNRIQSGNRGGGNHPARPAGRHPQPRPPHAGIPGPTPPLPPQPSQPPNPPADPGIQPPRGRGHDLPTGNNQATSPQGSPNPQAEQGTRRRAQPRHPVPAQPAASPRQQQLRQRLDRGAQRQPGTRRPAAVTPRRPSDATLSRNEQWELNRRRRRRDDS